MSMHKVSWQCAGHGVIERQRGGASVRSRWPAAHGAGVIGAQQVVGGVEGGRSRWGVEGRRCGTRGGTPLHVTARAPGRPIVHGHGPLLGARRGLSGTVQAVQVTVRANVRQRRVRGPADLGWWQRADASGDVGGRRIILTGANDGVQGMRAWCAGRERGQGGACVVVVSTQLPCSVVAWLLEGPWLICDDCRDGLQIKHITV